MRPIFLQIGPVLIFTFGAMAALVVLVDGTVLRKRRNAAIENVHG